MLLCLAGAAAAVAHHLKRLPCNPAEIRLRDRPQGIADAAL